MPYPEKLGLARSFASDDPDLAARRMGESIGLGRVTERFRAEAAELVERLRGPGDAPGGA